MSADIAAYLSATEKTKRIKHKLLAALPILSLTVIIAVFWWLKLTGITMAGEAFCGHSEHVHTAECYTAELVCEAEAAAETTVVCTKAEHIHSEECKVVTLVCLDEHEHTEECYSTAYSCTIEEHSHVPECYAEAESEAVHEHTDGCYSEVLTCTLEEHIHIDSCYSDINADIEDASVWEETLKDIPTTLTTAEKIAAVAESQLGYSESILNFEVDENGERHGYTRYGEWFGNKYGSWSSMFAAFCLRYAGLDEVPVSAGAETMRLGWAEAKIYTESDGYIAFVGDIVFLDKDGNGTADACAVVTEVTEGTVKCIEGDVDGCVAKCEYETVDERIMGYGTAAPRVNPVVMNPVGASPTAEGATKIAKTVDFRTDILTGNRFILYARGSDGNYYAIDGYGNAVRIYIDSSGAITTDVSDVNTLYWTFESAERYDNRPTYYIHNTSAARYLHPYNDANAHGAVLTGRWESALYQYDTGIRVRGARQNAYAVLQNNSLFTNTGTVGGATTLYLGQVPATKAVWLDGTNGGLMSFGGSPDRCYYVAEGSTMILPEEWPSPTKYKQVIRGWYDIVNAKYYPPGAEVTVTDHTVFYADWVAESYDIGVHNAEVNNETVSTADFIDIRLFDYNILFNVMSERANITVNESGHSETWYLVPDGNVPYNSQETLDYIFVDHDRYNEDISHPANIDGPNGNIELSQGLYTDELGEILFSTENSFNGETGEGIIGKTYLGKGDYLFYLDTNPESEFYGYYNYNSRFNAASYNQTDQRFYVYDYLERTSDSAKDSAGKYSDFLPLNSPYVNTNGRDIVTYTYNGEFGEYPGVTHYQYDCKYNTDGSSTSNAGTNLLFGMAIDMKFYLPDTPGTIAADGNTGNRDVFGKEMHFKFAGDDDVWIFVDGELVLDIGGIHGVESGDINFSTGVVTVNGQQTMNLGHIKEGDHVLTIYYLERGSSQSNCELHFNLAPRFSLSIQKEDVLTQHVLNGAQFSVFTDKECTEAATLWQSKASHDRGDAAINTFTVRGGVADMWGFAAGKTYYIKETKPPDKADYSCANGIICLTLDKNGIASYDVEIIDDGTGEVSKGFTVHGFKIDEETQQAYIAVTNAPEWVKETTTVQAFKSWADGGDHSGEHVTVYLTVRDPDGTVRRIREVVLGEENNWTYTWTNIPKYYADGVTEVEYLVEEAYLPGYTTTIEKVDSTTAGSIVWAEAHEFKNGETYVLKSSNGCLAATAQSGDAMLEFISFEAAKNSPQAKWEAQVNSDGTIKFKNEAGQILTLNYSGNANDCFFRANVNSGDNQNLKYKQSGSAGIVIYCNLNWGSWFNNNYYIGSSKNNYNALLASSNESGAVVFTPMIERVEEIIIDSENFVYRVTNTPLAESNETSVTVYKNWDTGMYTGTEYEKALVTVKLYADGVDTGRTVTLSLKNGWTETFNGLPYKNADGNVISYTVEESWVTSEWRPTYSEVTASGTSPPQYSVTVTNTYKVGESFELPATGGYGQIPLVYCGMGIMLVSLVLGCFLRRKKGRRAAER